MRRCTLYVLPVSQEMGGSVHYMLISISRTIDELCFDLLLLLFQHFNISVIPNYHCVMRNLMLHVHVWRLWYNNNNLKIDVWCTLYVIFVSQEMGEVYFLCYHGYWEMYPQRYICISINGELCHICYICISGNGEVYLICYICISRNGEVYIICLSLFQEQSMGCVLTCCFFYFNISTFLLFLISTV